MKFLHKKIKMYIEPKVESSYYVNNKGAHPSENIPEYFYPEIGFKIYDIVRELRPKVVVEFGVLNGYSTISIAQALRDNGGGIIYAYDLWEQYTYKHSTQETVRQNLAKHGLEEYVELRTMDFNNWCLSPDECDLLHLDISNDGNTIRQAFQATSCNILFEGGSEGRDECWWMKEFNKEPINSVKELTGYKVVAPQFPSLSLITRHA